MQKHIIIDASLPAELQNKIDHQLTLGLRASASYIEALTIRLDADKASFICSINASVSGIEVAFSVINLQADVCASDAIARLRRETLRIKRLAA